MFPNHLGSNEFVSVTASRARRLTPCIGGYARCVFGWTKHDVYGPPRLAILDKQAADAGKTIKWSYPQRSTMIGRIIRHPRDGDSYIVDAGNIRHWIPDGGTYNCLTASGYEVVNAFAGIDQRWVSIRSGKVTTRRALREL